MRGPVRLGCSSDTMARPTAWPLSAQVSAQHLLFEVFLGELRLAALELPGVRVDDGQWHHILVELKSTKDGKDIQYKAMLSLDYGMFQVETC